MCSVKRAACASLSVTLVNPKEFSKKLPEMSSEILPEKSSKVHPEVSSKTFSRKKRPLLAVRVTVHCGVRISIFSTNWSRTAPSHQRFLVCRATGTAHVVSCTTPMRRMVFDEVGIFIPGDSRTCTRHEIITDTLPEDLENLSVVSVVTSVIKMELTLFLSSSLHDRMIKVQITDCDCAGCDFSQVPSALNSLEELIP